MGRMGRTMIAVIWNDLNDVGLVVWGVALGESVWPLPSPRPHPGPLPPSGRGGRAPSALWASPAVPLRPFTSSTKGVPLLSTRRPLGSRVRGNNGATGE